MRFTSIAQLALAAAPALVSAESGRLGFALGAKLDDGRCKESSDYAADLAHLKEATGTNIVRGYSATSCDENGINCCDFAARILPVANTTGFKVVLGIWSVETDSSTWTVCQISCHHNLLNSILGLMTRNL